MNLPRLDLLCFHHDYDGLVAAAMVVAASPLVGKLESVQYGLDLNWLSRRLHYSTGIVDFLYHPAAVLWIDHHATSFTNDDLQQAFTPDEFHVFDPAARSCPSIIERLPWFDGVRSERWLDYIKWAEIIDTAAYSSPAEADDLGNPHILLSRIITEVADLTQLVQTVAVLSSATEVVRQPALESVVADIVSSDSEIRALLLPRVRLDSWVALLDQSDLPYPYRRYLAYEVYPSCIYGIGCYRSGDAVIVSVGENPWNGHGCVHLGHLCREFGGGGRQAAAGVPAPSEDAARTLAALITRRLNEAVKKAEGF